MFEAAKLTCTFKPFANVIVLNNLN